MTRRAPATSDVDRRVVRRALLAGALVWTFVAGVLLAGVIGSGGPGRHGLVVVLLGLTLGTLVAAGWLLLSIILDLLAGTAPGRHRVRWAASLFAVAVVCPMLVLGAAGG